MRNELLLSSKKMAIGSLPIAPKFLALTAKAEQPKNAGQIWLRPSH